MCKSLNTCQSRGVYKDRSIKKRDVVSRVEAVPECTEQKHGERAMTSFIDDVA